jgi:hypothetical protein
MSELVRARWLAAAVAGGGALREFLAARTQGLRFACPGGDAPLAPLILTGRTAGRVHAAASRVSRLVVRLGLHLAAGDSRRLADAVGLADHPARRLIGAGPSRGWSPAMVRPDLVLCGGVPKVLELNYNSTLGGSTDSETLAAAYQAVATRLGLYPPAGAGGYSTARGALALDIAAAAGLGRAPRIALIYSGLERGRRFSRFFDEELECLSRKGFDVVMAEIGQVDTDGESIAVDGRRMDVAFRVYNGESALRNGHDPEQLAALERVRRTSFVATSECLLFTSNALLAQLFEHVEALEEAERRLVARCVPWTVHLVDRRVERFGRRHDLDRYALANRDRLVIKPLNGHSGLGVVFGASVTATEWEHALELAFRTRTSCLQERVVPDETPVPVHHADSGTVSIHRLPSVLGPFRLGRRPGGIAVRHPVPRAESLAVNWEDGVLHNVAMAA